MLKRICFCLLIFVSLASTAQEVSSYEIEKDYPVFLDQIKQELTYPMAWGNSPLKDFPIWRKTARAIVLEAMLTPPPVASKYDMEVVSIEHRSGYEARKIRFNLSAYSRVPAYLLVPEGEGPFPAVVLLHDHGAHFSIGKEKMIRPILLCCRTLTNGYINVMMISM